MENNFNVAAQSASSVTTNKVLRNTYALLGVSLFPTVIGALLGMNMSFAMAQTSPMMFMLLTLAGIFGMFF